MERGEQYKRAIQVYFATNRRYPPALDDLETNQTRHFLRHKYIDPMTGKSEWRIIHIQNGVLVDSVLNKNPGKIELRFSLGRIEPRGRFKMIQSSRHIAAGIKDGGQIMIGNSAGRVLSQGILPKHFRIPVLSGFLQNGQRQITDRKGKNDDG